MAVTQATNQEAYGMMRHNHGLETLQSAKQRAVLDTIDKLRTCGLDNELSLPQLVVCGDQSAGKSSVLEALTEIQFPRADEVCTRFATEIILRRAATESVTIKINPDRSRPQDEQEALETFSDAVADFSCLTVQLASIIEKAKAAMGIGSGMNHKTIKTFSRDVLSIEITGPARPQLTVVDLPGLIQNDNGTGDKKLLDELTMRYITQSRTICLAVISATYDADNQRILTFVKEADPEGDRSLGIITKPDILPHGSGSERAFLDLAKNKNKKYFFKLGWHVLRNRRFEETDVSFAKRNELEEKYFQQSNFKEIARDAVGIGALAQRLSGMLFEHVKRELPDMRCEVERMLDENSRKLVALGRSRTTVDECRDYLMDLGGQLYEIGKNALHGNYEGTFFENNQVAAFGEQCKSDIRRLRAIVQQMNEEFAERMRTKGYTYHVGPEPDDTSNSRFGYLSSDELTVLQKTSEKPVKLPYDVALTWAQQTIARNRGRELQGNYNPLVISELFRTQSKNWQNLAQEHIDRIKDVCSKFLYDGLSHSCSADVRDNIWTEFLEEALKTRETAAHEFLARIMRSYRDHPINHNHYYTDTIHKSRQNRQEKRINLALQSATLEERRWNEELDHFEEMQITDTEACVRALSHASEADMARFSCEEALDCTRAIYKVKQKVFVDVVVTLVVEDHIVRDLEHIFSPKIVGRLKDEEVERIASEPDSLRRERLHYLQQEARLRDGRRLLRSAIGGSSV